MTPLLCTQHACRWDLYTGNKATLTTQCTPSHCTRVHTGKARVAEQCDATQFVKTCVGPRQLLRMHRETVSVEQSRERRTCISSPSTPSCQLEYALACRRSISRSFFRLRRHSSTTQIAIAIATTRMAVTLAATATLDSARQCTYQSDAIQAEFSLFDHTTLTA